MARRGSKKSGWRLRKRNNQNKTRRGGVLGAAPSIPNASSREVGFVKAIDSDFVGVQTGGALFNPGDNVRFYIHEPDRDMGGQVIGPGKHVEWNGRIINSFTRYNIDAIDTTYGKWDNQTHHYTYMVDEKELTKI
jgi:hypothetical protein